MRSCQSTVPSAGVVFKCTFSWILEKWIKMFYFVLNIGNNIINLRGREMLLLSQIGFLCESHNFRVERNINILRFCFCNWQTWKARCLELGAVGVGRLCIMLSWYRGPADTRTWMWLLRGRDPHGRWDKNSGVERTAPNFNSAPRWEACEKNWVNLVDLFLTYLPGDLRSQWLTNPCLCLLSSLCTRPCAKHFACDISFHSCINPGNETLYYHWFRDEQTGLAWVTWAGSVEFRWHPGSRTAVPLCVSVSSVFSTGLAKVKFSECAVTAGYRTSKFVNI